MISVSSIHLKPKGCISLINVQVVLLCVYAEFDCCLGVSCWTQGRTLKVKYHRRSMKALYVIWAIKHAKELSARRHRGIQALPNGLVQPVVSELRRSSVMDRFP